MKTIKSMTQILSFTFSVAVIHCWGMADNVDLPDRGEAFHKQAILAANEQDLDKAIELWEQAWAARGIKRSLARKYSINLCKAYMMRSLKTGGGTDVARGVKYYIEAKKICDANPEMVIVEDDDPVNIAGMSEKVLDAAMNGDVDAMAAVGLLYAMGDGFERDQQESEKWLQKAAELGNALAMRTLGQQVLKRYEQTKSHIALTNAMHWFSAAKDRGDGYSEMMIGRYYFSGKAEGKGWKDAKVLWENAAEKNETSAMSFLAYMYHQGRGVPVSYETSRKWYERAIAHGSYSAMHDLAHLYFMTNCQFHADAKGLALLNAAASEGHGMSMKCLGDAYYYGVHGVRKDQKEALKLYESAANKNVPAAQYMYGCMLWHGEGGVEANENAAKGWFRRAARLGDPNAKKYLRQINDTGDVGEGSSSGTNTGNVKNKEERENLPPTGKYLTDNPFVGFGRGLSSVVTSPGNIIWGAGAGFVRFEMESPILGLGTAIGVLGGCGVCVSDIVLGCADMMTFGWLGNRYFYNENSWGITPWFFTHDWFK